MSTNAETNQDAEARFAADRSSQALERDWRGPAAGTYVPRAQRGQAAASSSDAWADTAATETAATETARPGSGDSWHGASSQHRSFSFGRERGLRAQLFGGFGVVVVMIAILSTFAVVQLSDLKATIQGLAHESTPSLDLVATAETEALQYRTFELQHIFSATPEDRAKEEKSMADAQAKVDDALSAYEKNYTGSAEEKTAVEKASAAWADYLAASRQVLALSSDNNDAAATALTRGAERDLRNNELKPAFAALHDMNITTSNEHGANGINGAARSITFVVVVCLLTASAAAALAWFLSRRIVGRLTAVNVTLADVSGRLDHISTSVDAGATNTSHLANDVASGTGEVSASVQTVASAVEEMNMSIQEIAINASEASRVTSDAVSVARDATDSVARLGEASQEIGQVAAMISSIAEQTNLLALNATIEAARAGEAGKGFAVVASEVKDLAQDTTKATEEITSRIAAIQSSTEAAVAAISQVSTVIDSVNDLSSSIAGAVEQQGAATSEIARSVGDAASATDHISNSVGQLAGLAELTSQQVTEVREATDELSATQGQLRKVIGG